MRKVTLKKLSLKVEKISDLQSKEVHGGIRLIMGTGFSNCICPLTNICSNICPTGTTCTQYDTCTSINNC